MKSIPYIRKTQHRHSRAEHGLAMVEFAVILPLLLLFFVTAAEFGGLFFTSITLTKSVENGARFLGGNIMTGGGVANLTAANIADARALIRRDGPSDLTDADIDIVCAFGSTPIAGGQLCAVNPGSTLSAIRIDVTYPYIMGGAFRDLAGEDLNLPLDLNIPLRVSTTMPVF